MRIAVAGGTGTVGRHVVAVARQRGHEVVGLSRSAGVDLRSGAGLASALAGVEIVIDVASVMTQNSAASAAFFGEVTRSLHVAEEVAGVGHHVALSIVGIDGLDGYYAGKRLQESLVADGPVPWTLLRATQFHEFAAQVYGQVRLGPLVAVPVMRSQPIAAADVASRLVELAERPPAGRVRDLVGPAVLRLDDMVRAWARATGRRDPVLAIPLPGALGRAMRDGTLTAAGRTDVDHGIRPFAEWVAAQAGGDVREQ